MLLRYIQDFRHALELRSVKDASLLYTFNFPTEGSVTDFSSWSRDDNTTELFVKVESFLNPGTIHRCLISTNVICGVFIQDQVRSIETRVYQMDVVRASGKDGTLVPILVVHKKVNAGKLHSFSMALVALTGRYMTGAGAGWFKPNFAIRVRRIQRAHATKVLCRILGIYAWL